MALAKERIRQNSQSSFSQGIDPSTIEFFGSESHIPISNFAFMNALPYEAQSSARVNNWAYTNSSLLSFEQSKLDNEEACALWIDSMDHDQYGSNCANSRSLSQDYGEDRFGFLYPDSSSMDSVQDSGEVERSSQKRPYMSGDVQVSKKLCGNNKKAKAKPSPSKDPQSIAAKNRRERISERLKVLQDLVPNGTKVDLVTMLEKAISYVKFLQLQVKVLATDEFWPAQGGRAPEIAQVKEAIDAILSSHRDRNSSSKQ
ncbi:uncharacterized protein A4U43_C06F5880 [Asparagus officinalis]|uniref:BHLH domain-containing protein n=1 Tax=Asparagus officinalis TaxID=4686 RepID=A0A5P1ENY1_ASPOF|nr:transcription factor bHLH83-like [Asparagus officinalis]ONK66261.1 uncharacterized protein A4U43_C06F5880 [Asparagus officinalis]